MRANKGAIDVELGEGNIQVGKDTPNVETVVADGDINMTTGNGTITISGKTKSNSDSVNLKANKKNNSTTSNYESSSTFFAADSDEIPSVEVNLFDDAEELETGDITVDAEIEANDSVWIATDEGDIEITKKITVNDGDIIIATLDGDITIDDNGEDDMLFAQNDLDIETNNGAIDIAGKISTQDGDITLTSNHDTYIAGQKGITVEETGAINPGRNLYLNVINGDIEFKQVSAENAEIKAVNGDVTADTIRADDTIRIELENGNLYLNLARSKGVVILADENSKQSSVNTIRANSVQVDRNLVKVRSIISSKSSSGGISGGGGSGGSGGGSYSQTVSDRISNLYGDRYSDNFISGFNNNLASDGLSSATLGTASTRSGSGLTTYWQDATSAAQSDYSFSEFDNDMSYRLTRNYFEVRFIPSWLEKEFLSIDFDYSFDDFGIRNANEDELTID